LAAFVLDPLRIVELGFLLYWPWAVESFEVETAAEL
jgi:hypothetical protein